MAFDILIVEDDPFIYEPVKDWLTVDGYEVEIVQSAETGIERATEKAYDLLIVDVVLPGMSGIDFCKKYRADGGRGRILIVSGMTNTDDKLSGLSAGADDYIVKPFDTREVIARLDALMRRSIQVNLAPIEFADVKVDVQAHRVFRDGKELKLVPMEFALLEFMLRQPNHLFTANDLLKFVWKGNGSIDTVRTHVKTLRKKLERPGQTQLIRTIHGVGYCFTNEW